MREWTRMAGVALVATAAAAAAPALSNAQLVTGTSVNVSCLTGTNDNCTYMAFLLETMPSAMAIQSFLIIDGSNTNPLEFTVAGAEIFQGTDATGTDVTSQFNITLGASGVNVNRFLGTDPAAPYTPSPLFFLVHTDVGGSLEPLTYQMILPTATNTSGKSFTGDVGISSTVPEPVSILLLGTGLLGMGAIRRRRRNGGDYTA